MKLSIVMPAYNEAENIMSVISELTQTIGNCLGVSSYEIIIADDHSSDDTFSLVHQLGDKNIRCIRLSRRSGSHTAIRAGLVVATGDAVLCISADGQDNPDVLSKMIEKISRGAHTVWAIRNEREETLKDKLAANLFYYTLKLFASEQASKIDLANADFYLLSRKSADAINLCNERNTSLFGLIIWIGFKQDSVNYDRRERINGKSKWSLKSRMKLAQDWIMAFSGIPLRFITYLGIAAAILGFIYASYIFIAAISGYTAPGWAETALLILLGGGVLMIMLGIIGEYLWRTLEETRKRPLYFLEDDTQNINSK